MIKFEKETRTLIIRGTRYILTDESKWDWIKTIAAGLVLLIGIGILVIGLPLIGPQ